MKLKNVIKTLQEIEKRYGGDLNVIVKNQFKFEKDKVVDYSSFMISKPKTEPYLKQNLKNKKHG